MTDRNICHVRRYDTHRRRCRCCGKRDRRKSSLGECELVRGSQRKYETKRVKTGCESNEKKQAKYYSWADREWIAGDGGCGREGGTMVETCERVETKESGQKGERAGLMDEKAGLEIGYRVTVVRLCAEKNVGESGG